MQIKLITQEVILESELVQQIVDIHESAKLRGSDRLSIKPILEDSEVTGHKLTAFISDPVRAKEVAALGERTKSS